MVIWGVAKRRPLNYLVTQLLREGWVIDVIADYELIIIEVVVSIDLVSEVSSAVRVNTVMKFVFSSPPEILNEFSYTFPVLKKSEIL